MELSRLMAIEKLRVNDIRRAMAEGKRCRLEDGGGLRLVITGPGTAAWMFRYRFAGQRPEMGLGSYDKVPLDAAREIAAAHRLALARDIDPKVVRDERRRQIMFDRASLVTFKQAAEALLDHRDKTTTNKRLNGYWRSTLTTYAMPVLGTLSVATIERSHVLKVVEPLWTTKPETAERVRQRIEAVIDAAIARGQRRSDNPAKWDALKPVLGKRGQATSYAALDWRELPGFMKALRADESLSARALEFAILTAGRTNEVLGARWEEVDGDVWSIPAARMKMRSAHKVPLAAQARALLARLHNQRRPPFIFPGAKDGKSLSNMAMTKRLRDMQRADITVHGMRATFRSWAAAHGHDKDAAEFALAHVPKGMEAIYQRDDLFAIRRTLMAAWARYCHGAA